MSIYANHLFEPGTKNNSWAHLFEYIKEGDRVLDVGCSTGYFGEALIHLKKCEVWGVDIDKGDIEEAKKRLSKAFILDINDTKAYEKLGKFDVIIFADVLEHLIDPRTTLRNIKALLRPEGKVIFSLPHMAHSSVRLDLLAGKFPYKNRGLLDNTHLHFYDMDEAKSIFYDAGYDIKQIDPVIAKYTQEILREKLKDTGITPTKRFQEYLSETNGDIFQIVGYAQSSTKKNPSRLNRDYVMPQDEMYEQIVHLQDSGRVLEEENNRLKSELNSLRGSASWKITKPLRAAKTVVNKAKKKKQQ